MLRIKTLAAISMILAIVACGRARCVQAPVHFTPLEVGQIHPEGWLHDWAEDAANGITGHLDEYEQVFEYGWLGRDISARQSGGDNIISSTGWLLEQCAYWLDGALKLGFMLGDSTLISKTTSRLDGVPAISRILPAFSMWIFLLMLCPRVAPI